MTIKLTTEQEAWLQAGITRGAYRSVEDAVRQLIDERIAEDSGDLAWVKPALDEARAEIERGEGVSHDDFKRHMREHIEALRRE